METAYAGVLKLLQEQHKSLVLVLEDVLDNIVTVCSDALPASDRRIIFCVRDNEYLLSAPVSPHRSLAAVNLVSGWPNVIHPQLGFCNSFSWYLSY